MFLRPNHRTKDGKDHIYWSLVETVRTADGPRQRRLCYLGELNSSAQARWLKTVEVFNEQGESTQLTRISHTPSVGESKRRARRFFPQAFASRHFWVGIAGGNQLLRVP